MTTWLNKQKKADLLELADEAGLRGVSNLNKAELVDSIEKHLRDNSATLSKKSAFDPFYNTARANSPIKREPAASSSASAGDAAEPKKQARRRVTLTNSVPPTAVSPSTADARALLPAGTPTSLQRVARAVPLPSSPQAVTDLVERQSAAVSRFTTQILDSTHASDIAIALRDNLSSVNGITTLFILLEAYALQRVTLPWRHAFNVPIPLNTLFGVATPQPVSFPDFFVLLTAAFWAPTALWLGTAVLGPVLVGWLFNISRAAAAPHGRRAVSKQTPVDPVAFNIARGVAAWLVFAQKWSALGLIDAYTARKVDAALWGGSNAVIVTSAIATLAGVYEAVLRRQ